MQLAGHRTQGPRIFVRAETAASKKEVCGNPLLKEKFMASNRGLAYMGPGRVEVQSIDFPK
ncbi:MAG: hypothetical protein ACRD2B_10425, partial [Terriglobia bacterium]